MVLCASLAGCAALDGTRKMLEELAQEVSTEIGGIKGDLDAVKDIAADASLTPEERERMIAELEAKIDERTGELAGKSGELFRDVADRLDDQQSRIRELTEGAGDVAVGVGSGNWPKVIGGVIAIVGTLFWREKKVKAQIHEERDDSRELFGAPPAKAKPSQIEAAPLPELVRTFKHGTGYENSYPSSYHPPAGPAS